MYNKADNLYRLIKSLTKAEKRYFKINASRHTIGEINEYVQLFNLIEKSAEQDEKKLMKEFVKSGTPNKYAIAKTRLFDAVLKSLESFHANSSVDIELGRLLHSAEILFKKSLYDECIKLVAKAKKIAVQNEKFSVLLDVAQWEKKIIEKDAYAAANESEIVAMYENDKNILQRIENYNEYWNLKSLLFINLNKRGKARAPEELDNFKKIIAHPLLKSETEALSFDARYLYYQINYTYNFALNDYLKSYDYTQQMIALLEANPAVIATEPNKYFAVLSNMIYFCSRLKKYDETPVYLAKLRSLRDDLKDHMSEDIELKLFTTIYSSELSVCMETADYEKALDLVPPIEKGLKYYGDKINFMRESFFCFNLAIVFFANNDFNKSLKWVHRMLNNKNSDTGQDLYCMARIFNVIVHIELGNDQLIPYEFKSTQRYLTKRNKIFKFETVMLNFIRNISSSKTVNDEQQIYKNLLHELHELTTDKFERGVFEYFDFIAWVESKISRHPFSEIAKARLSIIL